MAFSWLLRKRKHADTPEQHDGAPTDVAATIRLRVEDGLLMAFGPDDDPMPPALVKSLCADDPNGTLQLESGETVDKRRVLELLEAQQRGRLSDSPHDGWIETMLRLGGAFEPAAPELLANEPLCEMPPRPGHGDGQAPDGRPDPATEVVTPLAFDKGERCKMEEADAVIFRGFETGMSLSAGRYDPASNGWILRPRDLPSLAIFRAEEASRDAEIDVTAVALQGKGKHWPVTTKRIELS